MHQPSGIIPKEDQNIVVPRLWPRMESKMSLFQKFKSHEDGLDLWLDEHLPTIGRINRWSIRHETKLWLTLVVLLIILNLLP